MKKILLLADDVAYMSAAAPDCVVYEQLLRSVFDDTLSVSVIRDPQGLKKIELREFEILVNASGRWKEKADKETAAKVITYVVGGGNYLSIHNGLKNGSLFEMDCMNGAKFLDEHEICLLQYQKTAKEHAVTEWFTPFEITEKPMEFILNPLMKTDVLLETPYVSARFPALWVHSYGWGKVACLSAGMSVDSFSPYFEKILYRIGQWFMRR